MKGLAILMGAKPKTEGASGDRTKQHRADLEQAVKDFTGQPSVETFEALMDLHKEYGAMRDAKPETEIEEPAKKEY